MKSRPGARTFFIVVWTDAWAHFGYGDGIDAVDANRYATLAEAEPAYRLQKARGRYVSIMQCTDVTPKEG